MNQYRYVSLLSRSDRAGMITSEKNLIMEINAVERVCDGEIALESSRARLLC